MSDAIVFYCRPAYFRFGEKCYNQSAVDKNGRHVNENACYVCLMSIYTKFMGGAHFLGNEIHLAVPKSRFDIFWFDTGRSGSVYIANTKNRYSI